VYCPGLAVRDPPPPPPAPSLFERLQPAKNKITAGINNTFLKFAVSGFFSNAGIHRSGVSPVFMLANKVLNITYSFASLKKKNRVLKTLKVIMGSILGFFREAQKIKCVYQSFLA
jgi:hypothetical protein